MIKETRRPRSKHVSITCKRVTISMMDYLAEELNNKATLIFEGHLSDCPDCTAFLSTYKKTIQATQSLRCENIPADVENRVRKFFTREN